MWLNNPQSLGRVISVERSSPKTQCHLSTSIRFLVQVIAEMISLKWLTWCGVSNNVMLNVSITHPRISWQVDQVQFPVYILFRDRNYFQLDLPWMYMGRNTFSIAWNKVIRMWRRLWVGPWYN